MTAPRDMAPPSPSLLGPGKADGQMHPAFYVAAWIFFSNVTILFNKWLLDTAGFRYRKFFSRRAVTLVHTTPAPGPAVLLTTLHLCTATAMTQLLARTTPLLDSRHALPLTGRLYLRAVLPIGVLYTASLVFSNLSYLHLSVSFIQMLKAFAPVTTLAVAWAAGISRPAPAVLAAVGVITAGVLVSSLAEVEFRWLGFFFAMAGTVAESTRLLLIQVLLKSSDDEGGLRMDPLVGLYYYAPVCALLNGVVAFAVEVPSFDWADLERVGLPVLGLNGMVAFLLNVASVFLIGRTSALAMNLTGILKAILLVVASMFLWGTPVTLLQAFGYSIALVGMFYYSAGPETARAHLEACRSSWHRLSGGNPSGLDFGPSDRGSESGAWSRFQSVLSGPWAQYTRVPTSDHISRGQDIEDAESGSSHREMSPSAEKMAAKEG